MTPLYAFDIETTSLSPVTGRLRSIGVYSEVGSFFCETQDPWSERGALRAFGLWMHAQPRGVVVGWNSSGFDVPFLLTRIAMTRATFEGGALLDAVEAKDRPPKYEALEGHRGGYRVRSFFGHQHADVAWGWKAWADEHGVTWSLKPVARANGFEALEEDRSAIAELSSLRVMDYNMSDSRVTYELAKKLDDAVFAGLVD